MSTKTKQNGNGTAALYLAENRAELDEPNDMLNSATESIGRNSEMLVFKENVYLF